MRQPFELGDVVMTASAGEVVSMDDVDKALHRYVRGDWGDTCLEDWKQNDDAVKNGERILAVYHDSSNTTFWIITEWDRSYTTVLLPSDY
jgi:hypothetical protein